eukprot:comp19557_c0_seq1/m.22945 comp19557_c0_seq1/g.22945  ORF comp19557_c0_seq1/g.22945 comp19557_c0_seq1/m.22945 type:complete len:245 (-) comp19557_c0_seq1:59-793(-)
MGAKASSSRKSSRETGNGLGPKLSGRKISQPQREATSSEDSFKDADSFSLGLVDEWFGKYTDEDKDTIGPSGMERLCDDLGVVPEDITMLVLAWQLNAKTMGYFTREEWRAGMERLRVQSTEELRGRRDDLKKLLADKTQFKALYRYAYDFVRDPDQRSVDMDRAVAMLGLLLVGRWRWAECLIDYLQGSTHRGINRDQWTSLYEFTLLPTDLATYDENSAWPVMLDEFVEYLREKGEISKPQA